MGGVGGMIRVLSEFWAGDADFGDKPVCVEDESFVEDTNGKETVGWEEGKDFTALDFAPLELGEKLYILSTFMPFFLQKSIRWSKPVSFETI